MDSKYTIKEQPYWLAARIIILLMFVLLLLPGRVHADSITVRKSEASANFPQNITFVLSAESTAKIDRATLLYGVTTETCFSNQARHDMEFQPATSVELKWEWDLFRSGDLPPGVEIWWQWEIHAEDGSSITTEIQKQTIEDRNFQWKKLQKGSLSIYWASGSNTFGQALLNIAVSSTDRLSKSAGFVSQTPVRLYIYPTADDMKKILAHTTEWMGGVAFPEYKIILIGIPTTSLEWAKEVIPHELAHLELNMRTYNCLNQGAPSWFGEGMAEFAQGPVSEEERAAIIDTLDKGSLQSLASIAEGFPADAHRADLAYMQSRQVVTFMIDTYGQEKLQALLDLFQSGENIDPALRSIYGLDTNGMDQTWRASLGFGVAPEPSFATATPAKKGTAIPTMALMQPYGQVTDTPAQAPSPMLTLTATPAAAVAAIATSAPAPTATKIPLAGDPGGTGAAPNTMIWLLAGGAGIAILLVILAVWLVLTKINSKK